MEGTPIRARDVCVSVSKQTCPKVKMEKTEITLTGVLKYLHPILLHHANCMEILHFVIEHLLLIQPLLKGEIFLLYYASLLSKRNPLKKKKASFLEHLSYPWNPFSETPYFPIFQAETHERMSESRQTKLEIRDAGTLPRLA